MNEPADGATATPSWGAWQPFTFGGVAEFARAGFGRLFVAQLTTAILVACSVVYFFHHGWSPAVLQFVQEMPESAKISKGHLQGLDDIVVAGTKFFAIAVTPKDAGQIGQSADVQLQFRPADFRIGTVFLPDWGVAFPYDSAVELSLGRSNLEPWWGAWQPVFLTETGVGVFLALFVSWALLAVLYTVPAKCIAWLADRQLTWGGAWRLALAALLPGAFLVLFGILLYAWQAIDLLELSVIYGSHLVVGWVYIVGAPLACPRNLKITEKPNPFGS